MAARWTAQVHTAVDPEGGRTQSCFSQWWMADFWSVDHTYCCMEQYMMAAKAELFRDLENQEKILKCSDPKQVKALGRQVWGVK